MRLGVIIGRFQVHKLTEGHLYLLFTAKAECDRVLVLLGSANQPRSIRNPLTASERMRLFSDLGVSLGWVEDRPADDRAWSKHVDSVISSYIDGLRQNANYRKTKVEVRLYHGRDSFAKHYMGEWRDSLKYIDPLRKLISGTDTRKRLLDGLRNSEDYRAGIIVGVLTTLGGQS